MSENRPRLPSSGNMQAAERCISPQNSGIRKSARLLKPSLLHTHQDSAPSTSTANPLPSPTADSALESSSSASSNPKDAAVRSRNRNKWDPATENLFFDAVKLYGKDYDAISKYITQKSKPKSFTRKIYEQVRNYYHNTATKLLSLLDLSEIDVSKEIKELFALVNYGEWKRKTRSAKLNAKGLKFFSSLVMNGFTTIRLRTPTTKTAGKKKRPPCTIRTPMCPALRKYLEEAHSKGPELQSTMRTVKEATQTCENAFETIPGADLSKYYAHVQATEEKYWKQEGLTISAAADHPPVLIPVQTTAFKRKQFCAGKDDIPIDTTMPKNMTIELSPNSQRDRAYVLGCWQNPFIRFELNMNQPVGEWLRWLQHKWIPQDLRMKKTLLGEDISNELADLLLYPSADMTLRTIKLNPVGTKPAAVSAPSNSSVVGAASTSSIILGLLPCFGPKSSPSSSVARSEQWTPMSPGKNDRKRRKSTPAATDCDQQLSPVETSSMRNAKRCRQDLVSPTSDEGGGAGNNFGRQFSDAGDGESSCDACPAVATIVDVEDDPDVLESAAGHKPVLTARLEMVQSTEEDGALDRQDVTVSRDGSNRQQQQLPHCVVLNPDVLRNGLSLATCELLTCDKARVIRLKYSITPKTTQTWVNAVDSWNFFVNLVRSNFVDSLYKKPAAPPSTRVISPVLSSKISKAANEGAMESAPDGIMPDISDAVSILNRTVDEQRRQRQEIGSAVSDVFAAPQVVKPARGKISAKETAKADPPNTFSMAQSAAFVAHESKAFLEQMGQIIKKPVVVNRRRAVMVAPPAAGKVPVPPWSATTLSRSQYQRQLSDQGTLLLLPPSIGSSATTVSLKRPSSSGHDAAANESFRTVVMECQPSVESQHQSSMIQSQMQSTTVVMEHGSTLNTPDVSLMRLSPEPVCTATVAQKQQPVNEIANKEPCSTISTPVENAVGLPAGGQVMQPELITSDSFLDFSLGSFSGFGTKLAGSPKRILENSAMSDVVHALRMEPDESALSSPPRPIRIGSSVVHRNDGKNAYYQSDGIPNSNPFPSSSNLFPLPDALADNESSTTANFFAACAMATNLETPEKCKDDDRR